MSRTPEQAQSEHLGCAVVAALFIVVVVVAVVLLIVAGCSDHVLGGDAVQYRGNSDRSLTAPSRP